MISLFPSRTIAVEVFGFGVHWYGLLYLAAFLLAYLLLPMLQRYRNLSLSKKEWGDLLTSAVFGVILGGRLGYVLFYAPGYFLEHPLEVGAVWQGGMSSHGGFLGVTLALWYALRRRHIPMLAFADVVVVPVALGLALGRFGNFINQELYGTVSDLPWAIAIPGVEGLRHPTQIYAVVKDLLIAGICYVHLTRSREPLKNSSPCHGELCNVIPSSAHLGRRVGRVEGRTLTLFLLLYGVLRFLLEMLREQEYAGLTLGDVVLSRGQILTIPIIVVGMIHWWRTSKRFPLPAGEGEDEGRHRKVLL